MTTKERHLRAEVLRAVIDEADRRRDGLVPTDVEGVADTFGDEATLLGALHLYWYSRLVSHVEAETGTAVGDQEAAVVRAWVSAAHELSGVRMVLDEADSEKLSHRDHRLLADAAGLSCDDDAATRAEGRRLEARAREAYVPRPPRPRRDRRSTTTLVDRIRAVLAA